jgi:energy-coupling factor transport system permease protein
MHPLPYLDRDTFLHRLDPRTKMFLLLGMFVLAFVFTDPLYLLVVLAIVLFFGYLSRSLANLRRTWFILLAVPVVSVVLCCIFGGGRTPLFLFVEREALVYGMSIALRLDAAIIAGVIFLSTTRNEAAAAGLVRLRIPYRFAFAVSRALRLVPTMVATGMTIGRARRSRGFDPDSGNAISRIRKQLPLLVPVFVTTVRSTHVFSMAMESRGFGAGPGRTFFLRGAMGPGDALVLVVFALLLAGAIALRVLGYGRMERFSP